MSLLLLPRTFKMLSRRSRQRERLRASLLSICSSVCLFVCLSPKCKNAIFSKTKQFRAIVTIDDSLLIFKEPIIEPLKSKMAEIRHLGSWRQNSKTWFSGKLSNLVRCNWAFQRTRYYILKIQDGWDPPSWKSIWRHFFSAEGGPIWIKFRRLMQNDMSTAVMWSKSKPDVEFQYGGRLGEFNGMSSQNHLPHCRMLPPGEFNGMSS